MELKYEAALAEYKVSEQDLPEDAKTGIEQIKKILSMIAMQEKAGKKIHEGTFKKIKALDKWVSYEIIDFANETDDNNEDKPDVKKIEAEIKGQGGNGGDKVELNPLGLSIDAELSEMYKSNKIDWTFEEIKASAKKAYDAIFDAYEPGEQNGVETTNFTLIEKETEIFTLKKK
jgi:hypothetical protein